MKRNAMASFLSEVGLFLESKHAGDEPTNIGHLEWWKCVFSMYSGEACGRLTNEWGHRMSVVDSVYSVFVVLVRLGAVWCGFSCVLHLKSSKIVLRSLFLSIDFSIAAIKSLKIVWMARNLAALLQAPRHAFLCEQFCSKSVFCGFCDLRWKNTVFWHISLFSC